MAANLLALIMLGGLGYLAWGAVSWLRMPQRVLAREAGKLAVAASQAAQHGRFAERDRLDDARNAILTGIAGRTWEFPGSEFDDYSDRYFKPGSSEPDVPPHIQNAMDHAARPVVVPEGIVERLRALEEAEGLNPRIPPHLRERARQARKSAEPRQPPPDM